MNFLNVVKLKRSTDQRIRVRRYRSNVALKKRIRVRRYRSNVALKTVFGIEYKGDKTVISLLISKYDFKFSSIPKYSV